MFRSLYLFLALLAALSTSDAGFGADNRTLAPIQEEVWALPLIHPTIAYVARPLGKGPLPLAVMNHGVSLNARERGFFPLVTGGEADVFFCFAFLYLAFAGPGPWSVDHAWRGGGSVTRGY